MRKFERQALKKNTVCGSLASTISAEKEICFELSFDRDDASGDFLFIDIGSDATTLKAHVSIRLRDGAIVLNSNEGNRWGSEVRVNFDFSGIKLWTLLVVLSHTGDISISFAGTIIASTFIGLRSTDVTTTFSNIFVELIVKPQSNPSTIHALIEASHTGGARLIFRAENEEEEREIASALIAAGYIANDISSEACKIGNGAPWTMLNITRSDLRSLNLGFCGKTFITYSNLEMPFISVRPDYFSITSTFASADSISFCIDGQPNTHIKPRIAMRHSNASSWGAEATATNYVPISTFLCALAEDGSSRTIHTEIKDCFGFALNFQLDPRWFNCIESVVKNLTEEVGWGKIKREAFLLDLWNIIVNPKAHSILRSYSEGLHGLVLSSSRLVGDLLKNIYHESNSENTKSDQPIDAESPRGIPLNKALREISTILAKSAFDASHTKSTLLDVLSNVGQSDRNWIIAIIAERLVDTGIITSDSSYLLDTAEANALLKLNLPFVSSSLLPIFAVKGELQKCIDAMNDLAAPSDEHFEILNFAAISVALKHVLRMPIASSLRHEYIRSFLSLFSTYSIAHQDACHHFDIQLAMAQLVAFANREPNWILENITDVLVRSFIGVRRFWDVVDQVSRDKGAVKLAPGFDVAKRVSEFFEGAFTNLISFAEQNKLDVAGSVSRQLGASERAVYLLRVLRLHSFGPNAELPQSMHGPIGDFVERLLYPNVSSRKSTPSDGYLFNMRAEVQQLLDAPKAPFSDSLHALGEAIRRADFMEVLNFGPSVLDGSFASDPNTEAVIIDALVWANLSLQHNQLLMTSLAGILCSKLSPHGNAVLAPPGLQSAALRILRYGKRDFISANQFDYIARCIDRDFERQTKVPCIETNDLKSDAPFFSDTVIALITCNKYLGSRAIESSETWVPEAEKLGARVIVFVGACEGATNTDFRGELVTLAVGDRYEDLPSKILEVFRWVRDNTDATYVIKIDDDCYMEPDNYLINLSYRRGHYFGRRLAANAENFDRTWHQSRSAGLDGQQAIDCSPLGTNYADGGGVYSLSRCSLEQLTLAANSDDGISILLASFFEDKMIGDLLAIRDIKVSSDGYSGLQARRAGLSGIPVLQIDRTFYPNLHNGISVAHLDEVGKMREVWANRNLLTLAPKRIFPLHQSLSISSKSNMLEVLGKKNISEMVARSKIICVSVVRNEISIIPHFLAHYRALGVDLFIFIDNLSEDGTREFLCGQSDVLIFSAASEYRNSSYGLDWQRCVLDHFCVGRWVVVADADEFIVTEGVSPVSLLEQAHMLESSGYNAAAAIMVDMYPRGDLKSADFNLVAPSLSATAFDRIPVHRWSLNRGPFANMDSFVSALRHRLRPGSSPEMFTSQKIAFFRYSPLMSFSQGLHFAAGMVCSPRPLAFLHYKYSSDFAARALEESRRGQHFGAAKEYHAYLDAISRHGTVFWSDSFSSELVPDQTSPLLFLLGGCDFSGLLRF